MYRLAMCSRQAHLHRWLTMDSSRSFIAPGKIVLLGEYAVLDGAPAIVAAVNRGVRCTVSPHPSRLDIDAVNHRFVGPALAAWSDKPGHYRFEPHNPTETASKVGLGSSAAATVAAALAGSSWNNHPLYGDTLFKTAFGIHREVQGSGSGIDVAASVYGGMLQQSFAHHDQFTGTGAITTGHSRSSSCSLAAHHGCSMHRGAN